MWCALWACRASLCYISIFNNTRNILYSCLQCQAARELIHIIIWSFPIYFIFISGFYELILNDCTFHSCHWRTAVATSPIWSQIICVRLQPTDVDFMWNGTCPSQELEHIHPPHKNIKVAEDLRFDKPLTWEHYISLYFDLSLGTCKFRHTGWHLICVPVETKLICCPVTLTGSYSKE